MSEQNGQQSAELDSYEARRWLNQHKIRILLQNHRQSWMLSLMVSALFLYLAKDSGNFYTGLIWWLCFSAYIIFRAWASRCFSSLDFEIEDYEAWKQRLLVLALLAGIGWGVGGFLIAADLNPLMQMSVLLILMGVSAASVPLLGVYMNVMLAFQVPALWPYMIWMAYQLGWQNGLLLMFIFAFYVLGIVKSMRRLEDNLTDSLKMQYEYERLASSLNETNQQLQQANEKLEYMTLIDSLTQIHNRRYFEMQLEKEWKRSIREKHPLTIIMIDIDHFKLYNDTYGHATGDDCLRRVALTLKRAVNRPGDVFARIGGEEFVAMLPGIDTEGAYTVAEAMQHNLQQAKIPHATSPVSEYITISMGIASIQPDSDSTTLSLFKLADKALYKAKEKGRNQIVVAGEDI